MDPLPELYPGFISIAGPEAKQQKLELLNRYVLELSLSYEQTKVALLQKHIESLYHFISAQSMWQFQEQFKSTHKVENADTTCSDEPSNDEHVSQSGQEAGYPTQASCSPWTKAETCDKVGNGPVFRIEYKCRRDLGDAVKFSSLVRKAKIMRYKEKMRKTKEKLVFSRTFIGRSEVAKGKLRINGRFVKVQTEQEID